MTALRPTRPADQREAKLPNWAQDIINDLRRKLEHARTLAETTRLATDPDQSNTVIESYNTPTVGLGVSPNITFRLDANRSARVRVQNERLHVMAIDGSVRVHPESSNTFTVSVAPSGAR
jgi:hypothetical protein